MKINRSFLHPFKRTTCFAWISRYYLLWFVWTFKIKIMQTEIQFIRVLFCQFYSVLSWKGNPPDDKRIFVSQIDRGIIERLCEGNNCVTEYGRAVRYVSSVTLELLVIEYYISDVRISALYILCLNSLNYAL